MYDTTTFLKSEIDYRADRIRSGLARQGRRHPRLPRARRSGRVDGSVR